MAEIFFNVLLEILLRLKRQILLKTIQWNDRDLRLQSVENCKESRKNEKNNFRNLRITDFHTPDVTSFHEFHLSVE